MKFSCTRDNVSEALGLSTALVNKNVNLPILNNVLVKANEQKIEFVATNLEAAIIVSVRGVVETSGSFTVPGRTLAEFVALLSADNVNFELQGNELVVVGGKATTKIKGAVADEFPVLPTVGDGVGFVVKPNDLRVGLEQVLPAVAKSEIRPELSGVLFNFLANQKQLVLAATDSYRLAEKKITLEQGATDARFVVPQRAAQEVSRAIASFDSKSGGSEGVRLLVGDGQLSFSYNNIQIISRLVGSDFPEYTSIIPRDFSTTVVFSMADIVKELKAAGIFTTTGVNAVSFQVNATTSTVLLSSASLQTGEYSSELSAQVSGEGGSTILNHRYVLDGLSHLPAGAKVKVRFSGPDSPCLFAPDQDDSFLYVVMPIRQ